MEFITFIEKNTKEQETFIFYLQWTGNEEKLTDLYEFVKDASYDDLAGGEYSFVSMNIDVKIPEQFVDLQCSVRDGMNQYYPLFSKCVGTFGLEISDAIMKKNQYQRGVYIDHLFFSTRIRKMFK